MELPIELRSAIENATIGYKQKQLQEAAKGLTIKYTTQSGKGDRLVTKDIEAVAYAVVRMPATFGSISTALSYALEFYGDQISSVLDVGAGTAAASWSALSLIDAHLDFTCVEREDAMITLGKKFAASNASLSNIKWIKQDFSTSSLTVSADLVIASYALNELNEKSRLKVLAELWKATNKILIIVEPGTPVGFSQIQFARDMMVRDGGYIVAPCTHNGACPIEEGDWCHFTCRIARSKLHKLLKGGDVPYEDEKFSFIAISKTPITGASGRILRHPIKEPGKISLQLCTSNGLRTKVVTKKQGDLFKIARKSSCGDAF